MITHSIETKDGDAVITVTCINCGQPKSVTVPMEAYMKWLDGTVVQRAMPELSGDDREILISGVCGPCFETIFSHLPDDDA